MGTVIREHVTENIGMALNYVIKSRKTLIDAADDLLKYLQGQLAGYHSLLVLASEDGEIINDYSSHQSKEKHVLDARKHWLNSITVFCRQLDKGSLKRIDLEGKSIQAPQLAFAYGLEYNCKRIGTVCAGIPKDMYHAHTEALFTLTCKQIQERLNFLHANDDGLLWASLAHEIKNSLCTINGFAQLFSLGGVYNQAYLDMILEESERCKKIVMEFMYFNKPSNDWKVINVRDLLEDLVEKYQRDHNLPDITINLTCLGAFLMKGNIEQLVRVFENLFDNAVEAMGRKGEIIMSLSSAGSYLSIKIKDNGCGMDETELAKVFEPFYTTKSSGTGLGLLYCQKVVKGHGGSILLESKPGEGTTCTLVFPVATK
ncbi:MAG: HAMP domain-containing sensor histidine kinase [Bacillota bacterium]